MLDPVAELAESDDGDTLCLPAPLGGRPADACLLQTEQAARGARQQRQHGQSADHDAAEAVPVEQQRGRGADDGTTEMGGAADAGSQAEQANQQSAQQQVAQLPLHRPARQNNGD